MCSVLLVVIIRAGIVSMFLVLRGGETERNTSQEQEGRWHKKNNHQASTHQTSSGVIVSVSNIYLLFRHLSVILFFISLIQYCTKVFGTCNKCYKRYKTSKMLNGIFLHEGKLLQYAVNSVHLLYKVFFYVICLCKMLNSLIVQNHPCMRSPGAWLVFLLFHRGCFPVTHRWDSDSLRQPGPTITTTYICWIEIWYFRLYAYSPLQSRSLLLTTVPGHWEKSYSM